MNVYELIWEPLEVAPEEIKTNTGFCVSCFFFFFKKERKKERISLSEHENCKAKNWKKKKVARIGWCKWIVDLSLLIVRQKGDPWALARGCVFKNITPLPECVLWGWQLASILGRDASAERCAETASGAWTLFQCLSMSFQTTEFKSGLCSLELLSLSYSGISHPWRRMHLNILKIIWKPTPSHGTCDF